MLRVRWEEVLDPQPTEAERAVAEADFARLKSLAGEWSLVGGVRLGVELEAHPDQVMF